MREYEQHLANEANDINMKSAELQKQREQLERQQEELNAQKLELQQVDSKKQQQLFAGEIQSGIQISSLSKSLHMCNNWRNTETLSSNLKNIFSN